MSPFLSAQDPDPPGCAIGYGAVNATGLRCRAQPYATAKIVAIWPQGARIIVWAQRQDNWWLVESAAGGQLGWSFAGPGYISGDWEDGG